MGAPGPAGASVVLWSEGGNLDAGTGAPGEPLAGPELVAADAGGYGALAKFDPLTGRIVAVWLDSENQAAVDYAVRPSP